MDVNLKKLKKLPEIDMNFSTKQEELFLLTIYRLNEPAYPVKIVEHMEVHHDFKLS